MTPRKRKSGEEPLVPAVPQLDATTQKYLDMKRDEARATLGHCVWKLACIIRAVRDRLRKVYQTDLEEPPGFLQWCRDTLPWSLTQIYRLIWLAERFPTKPPPLLIARTASYYLTAPSAPAEALEEALVRAEAGEKITVEEAKQIISRHTPTIFHQPPTKPPSPGAPAAPMPSPDEGGDATPEQEAVVLDAEEQEAQEKVEPEPEAEAQEEDQADEAVVGRVGEEVGAEEGAAKPSRRPFHSYDASNGYRVTVWGRKGEALDPAQVKAALVEAAEKVAVAQQQ